MMQLGNRPTCLKKELRKNNAQSWEISDLTPTPSVGTRFFLIKETKMAAKKKRPATPTTPNPGNEEIPPGATTRAADRPIHQGGGPAGSGAGSRHAADDVGSPDEEYGAVDSNDPLADGTLADPDNPPEDSDA